VRRRSSRLFALMVAAVFAAANLGLPAADALLDHPAGGAGRVPRDHFEDQNGCREHADHCPLSRIVGSVRLAAAAQAQVPVPAAIRRGVPAPVHPGTPPSPHSPAYRSRAPPSVS
jgi:hypothetical protein